MLTDAQKRANKKWNDKNKEKMNLIKQKAAVKNYIFKKADAEQIEEIKEWIRQREENSED